jgi:hypothetical protein
MSRILVGEMAGGDEYFGSEVGQMRLTFTDRLTANPTQQNPDRPNDISQTINYHHFDISGHDGMYMSKILVGEMAGADEYFGWKLGKCG